MRRSRFACLLPAFWACLAAGCTRPIHFPTTSLADAAREAGAYRVWDTTGDGLADVFAFSQPGAAGRVTQLGYDRDSDGVCDERIALDAVPIARCRHLVIILDGFGYALVKSHYDAGGLRMFHQPSRVISPYPAMSDLSLPDILGDQPAKAMEAAYFDRKAGRLVGGTDAYLSRRNKSYTRLLQYSGHPLLDVAGYLYPWATFRKETRNVKRLFDRRESQELIAYIGTSAGVGTIMGAEGQRRCLEQIERMLWQILTETRGLTKVTMVSDHGQAYTPCQRLPLEDLLAAKGWRVRDRLDGDDDVVCMPFGLVTCASFATRRPAKLTADLATLDGVELVSFTEKNAVVVLAPGGQRAVIRQKAGRFRYEATSGDPLALLDALAGVAADAQGYHDADDLLKATADHAYPAPLQRLWRTHFGLVQNPPDVICSLANHLYFGSTFLASAVEVVSTHGGLNRSNSVTFIMSTAGQLPPVMRSRDIPQHMAALTGRPWPLGR